MPYQPRIRMHKAPPHITARLQACRTRIQQKGLDGYLVTRRTDQYYLTGFDGEDGAVLLLPRQVILVTDGRFREAAARTAPWAKAIIREDTLAKTVARLLKRHRLERIGFDPDHLTVRQHAGFRKEIRPARLVSLPGVTEQLRLIKDETEVTALREAIRIAESAFRTVIRQLRPGTTERQLAAALLFEMQREGAEGASFPIIVAEGPNSSLPHAVPGDRPIKRGSAVLIDWGAVYRGYCSDLTRVVFIHRIPPRFRRMYEHVLAAQSAAIRSIRPAVRMCDVYAAAVDRLKQAGMDRHFPHGLGHGIGLDIHEAPRISRRPAGPFQAGMVVTVEPGVYYPGFGGVRIEDDVLVTNSGCEILSHLERDLESMVVEAWST